MKKLRAAPHPRQREKQEERVREQMCRRTKVGDNFKWYEHVNRICVEKSDEDGCEDQPRSGWTVSIWT